MSLTHLKAIEIDTSIGGAWVNNVWKSGFATELTIYTVYVIKQ